jgi:hypothetical protein
MQATAALGALPGSTVRVTLAKPSGCLQGVSGLEGLDFDSLGAESVEDHIDVEGVTPLLPEVEKLLGVSHGRDHKAHGGTSLSGELVVVQRDAPAQSREPPIAIHRVGVEGQHERALAQAG